VNQGLRRKEDFAKFERLSGSLLLSQNDNVVATVKHAMKTIQIPITNRISDISMTGSNFSTILNTIVPIRTPKTPSAMARGQKKPSRSTFERDATVKWLSL